MSEIENHHYCDLPFCSWNKVDTVNEPVIRHEAAFIEFEGKLYLMGGRRIQVVNAFNPESREWKELSKPPLELHHFQALAREDGIWVVGALVGPGPNETPATHIYIYNPRQDKWTQGSEIPENRRRGSTGVVEHDGWIYVVGGIQRGHMGGFVPWLDRYNPKTGEWQVLPDAPHARDHFQAAIVDGRIYAVGGRTTSRETGQTFELTVPEVDVYHIASNQWKTLNEPMPTPRAGTSSAAYKQYVIVAGGESGLIDTAHSEVSILDTFLEVWKEGPPLERGRHGTGLAYYKGSFYTASGSGNRGGRPELHSVERMKIIEQNPKTDCCGPEKN